VKASGSGQRCNGRDFFRTPLRLVISLFAALPAMGLADDEAVWSPGWYVGGGVSYTEINAGSFGGLRNGNDSTDSNFGMVVTAGYKFGQYTAVEAGYLDAGALHFSSSRGPQCVEPDLCNVKVKQETTALTVAVVGILPLNRVWDIYAKVGAASWDAVANQAFASPSGSASATGRADLSGTDLLIGLGVGAALASRIRLRLEYESFETDDALLAFDRSAGIQQFALEVHWRI
jgi:hypothetical protein